MTDFDAFERRFAGRLHDYADAMPVAVDPVAIADRVAVDGRGSWRDRLASPFAERWHVSWMIAALLLVGMLAAALVAGAKLLERDQAPLEPAAFDGTVIAPGADGTLDALTTVDGAVWAVVKGTLVRFDPTSGVSRTWDIGDGPIFAGPKLASAADGGVWLIGDRRARHFDGATLGPPIEWPEGVALSDLAEGPDGSLWASSHDGVFRLRDDRWMPVQPNPAATDEGTVSADSIVVDGLGTVWASLYQDLEPNRSAIARYDGSQWEVVTETADGIPLPAITSLVPGPDGSVWAGAGGRLFRYDGRDWSTWPARVLGATGEWRPLPCPDGTVLVATTARQGAASIVRIERNGAVKPLPVTGLPAPAADGWSSVRIAIAGDGIAAATRSGLYRLEGERWERIWPEKDIASTPPLDLAVVDRDEAWGLATYAFSGGATKEVWHLTESGAMAEEVGPSATLRDLTLAADGTPLIASTLGLSARMSDGWRVVDPEPADAVAVDRHGAVWVAQAQAIRRLVSVDGTYMSTSELDLPRFGDISIGGVFPSIGPEMAVDGDGGVWFVGGNRGYWWFSGVYRVDGHGTETMTPSTVNDRTLFDDIVIAPDDTVWVSIFGTETGTESDQSCCEPDPAAQVARYADGQWTVYGAADGLRTSFGGSLAVTPSGEVWMSAGELYRFDGTRWDAVSMDVDRSSIVAGPNGDLWLSSGGEGVIRLTPSAH